MLQVNSLHAGYGTAQILFDVSMTIRQGDFIALMGRNGMGKTTLIRSLFNLTQTISGSILFENQEITTLPTYEIARLGLALVPEGRRIFSNLTVRENLMATARSKQTARSSWQLDDVFALFPAIAERQHQYGNQLSGGEQQMLAIGRALLTNPSLLILDEATEGLAPLVRREIWEKLSTLARAGQTLLVIDPDIDRLSLSSNEAVILENGRNVWHGATSELRSQPTIIERYLAVSLEASKN